ncbi:MAG: sulfotransferase [Acidimicrobiia bacterium]|nr:sulfotransferase [Acidimicrobiia bacterium]
MSNSEPGSHLIFLISQPRSGSTLLQKMLGAHPSIHTVSEPWLALYPAYALRDNGTTAEFSGRLYRGAVREFLRTLPEGERVWLEANRLMLEHLYGKALAASGKNLFLDKTPRYYHIIGELQALFPAARFLLLFRNPLSVFASILAGYKAEEPGMLAGSRHDLLSAPGLLLEGVTRLGSAAVRVQYEHMVEQPERVIRGICEFLGIEFLPGMIDYGESAEGRWLYGDQGTVYRHGRPITERQARWRGTLGRSAARLSWGGSYLDALGGETIARLGYRMEELRQELETVTPAEPGPAIGWEQLILG